MRRMDGKAAGVGLGLAALVASSVAATPATPTAQAGAMLTWTAEQQRTFYPAIETVMPVHVVPRGGRVHPLPAANPGFDPVMRWGGRDWTVDEFMGAYQVSGLLVMKDGQVLLERYGLGRKPTDRWTSFSVAKSITSLLVGAAIEDGKIRPEDPVERFLPELKGTAYSGVTLRQLLTMSSGVRWNEDYSDPNSDIRRIGQRVGEQARLDYLRRLPRDHPAGSVFHYNTAETDLVGLMLSRAVHATLADYLSAKIWRPYGMERDAVWIVDDAGHEVAGCCLSMTLRDYARLGQFTLDDGVIDGRRVTAPGWIEASTKVQIANGHLPPSGYGYFWWIGPKAYEASGIFGQSILVYPKEHLVIVVNSAWPRPDDPALFRALSMFQGAIYEAVAHGNGQQSR